MEACDRTAGKPPTAVDEPRCGSRGPRGQLAVGELARARRRPLPGIEALTGDTDDAAQQGGGETVRPQPRRTGTWSRSIGLPGKESRGLLQDLPLLTQHLVFALQLAQPLPLLTREHILALTAVGLVLPQPSWSASAPSSPARPPTASATGHRSVAVAPPRVGNPAGTAVSSLASPLLSSGLSPKASRRLRAVSTRPGQLQSRNRTRPDD